MADRYGLVFSSDGGKTEEFSYNGRSWTLVDEPRGIWKLTDTHVLIFNGGDAITVDRDANANVDTSFDMDKVPVAADITQSES